MAFKKKLISLILFTCLFLSSGVLLAQNIGVGIDPPLMKFHILNPGSDVLLIENSNNLSTGVATSLYFKTGNGSYPYTGAIKTIGDGSSAARLGLFTYSSLSPDGLLERISILDGGDVGMGTSTPKNRLHVKGGMVVGSAYAGIAVAPTDGATIQGNVRIGSASQSSERLKVDGNVTFSTFDGSTLFKVIGSRGVVQFNPFNPTATGTSLLGVFTGITARPQFSFRSDVDNNTVEIGMDNMGSFIIAHNESQKFKIMPDGNVAIGTDNIATDYKLSVGGKIASEEILVDLSGNWPDYVFDPDYHLTPLDEVQDYITKNGHLEGLPSAKVAEDIGIELGEMNRLLVEKVEELTLYILSQEKRIKALEEKLSSNK